MEVINLNKTNIMSTLPNNLMHLEAGTSLKLTKDILENTSYQFVTKAYKVLTGKGDFIGKKKADLIPAIVGKTYVEPEPVVAAPKKTKEVENGSTPRIAVPKMKRVIDEILDAQRSKMALIHFHKTEGTLKKIVTPLSDTVHAAWNRDIEAGSYYKPALSMDEKLIVDANQEDVTAGYVRVIRSHERTGKFKEVYSVRNFRNMDEPDWSVMHAAVRQETTKRLQEASMKHD